MSGHDSAVGTEPDAGDDRGLFRTIGAVHLGLAGGVNFAVGAGLIYFEVTGGLLRLAFAELDTYVSDQTLIREAGTVAAAAGTGAILAGVVLAVLGAAGIAVAVGAVSGRRRNWWVPASLASALDPLVAPLAFVAAVLLWLGRPVDDR
jgi:hypothetical protein